MKFPEVCQVRQRFQRPLVKSIESTIHEEFAKLTLERKIRPEQSVAITAGSRGIASIDRIIASLVRETKALGARPFVVPAMGSHGGGTAEGQLAVLRSLGITEESCGCPIRASMDTVRVCESREGIPIYFDQHASSADHVIVCNRIKPHTHFTGDIQSGLMKMMLIGLGKHEGAKIYHKAIQDFNFGQIVRSVAVEVIEKCKIAAGLAIVENAYDETGLIQGVHPIDFEATEAKLLGKATEWMARLPFANIDVLMVDQIGKDISGTGMDTNVIGRKYNDHQAVDHELPKVKRIIVRDLSPKTGGNASGIGLAEFAKSGAIEKMEPHSTATNCITSNHVTAGMIPIHFPSDQELVDSALATIGLTPPQDARLVWIHNTLLLDRFECSTRYLDEISANQNLEVTGDPQPLSFDETGNLPRSVFDFR